MKSFDYEVTVLGGGSAGYAAARATAAAGLKTAVIDGGSALGGLCILRGCMPSKALLYAAEVLHLARVSKTWGLKIPKAGFDFTAVMSRKHGMVEEFAHYRRHELTHGKFKLYRAAAQFLDPHTVSLCGHLGRGPAQLTSNYFIICTGSVAAPPPLPGMAGPAFIGSDEALTLKRPPKSLIVLGGGPVALELAQFFRRFDVPVTVIQRGGHLLRETDPDVAAAVEQAFHREGLRNFTRTQLTGTFTKGRETGVIFRHGGRLQRISAEKILVATGRIPATRELGLERIGVKTERGRILANAHMQTSQPHIYTAGDCTGPHQIVHVGIEQGEVAAHNILQPRRKKKMDYRLLCSVVFTDPQVAVVGLTETRAREQKIKYLTASHPFNDHGKAMIMGTKEGFVKLLANPKTGEILGGACVGPQAGELIHEIITAMRGRLTVGDLAAMPHYHPTLAEIWTYPASELAAQIK